MVLDSSVMNVSISQIVADLDTTIQGVQLAITAYTLVMAAFMLAGAKLGDILGPRPDVRDRPGRLRARLVHDRVSPNLTVLLIGWSLIEGSARRSSSGDRLAGRRDLQRPAARLGLRDRRRSPAPPSRPAR